MLTNLASKVSLPSRLNAFFNFFMYATYNWHFKFHKAIFDFEKVNHSLLYIYYILMQS